MEPVHAIFKYIIINLIMYDSQPLLERFSLLPCKGQVV